jgi:hypothetical protein
MSAFDFIEKVELVQTLDECKMSDYIPQSTSDGLREILLGCLCISPREFADCMLFFTYFYTSLLFYLRDLDKRIPASILLQSPWFRHHGINSFDDSPSLMRAYLESCSALKAAEP